MITKEFIDVYTKDSGISSNDMKNIMNQCFPHIKKSVIRKEIGTEYEEISLNDAITQLNTVDKSIKEIKKLYTQIFLSVWSVDVVKDIIKKMDTLPNGELYANMINILFIDTGNRSIMDLDLALSRAMRYKYRDESLIMLGYRIYFFIKNSAYR